MRDPDQLTWQQACKLSWQESRWFLWILPVGYFITWGFWKIAFLPSRDPKVTAQVNQMLWDTFYGVTILVAFFLFFAFLTNAMNLYQRPGPMELERRRVEQKKINEQVERQTLARLKEKYPDA
jgi:hypothetical protein